MSHTFFPPTVDDDPQFDVDATPDQERLMRHFKPHTRGINVFKLSANTFVQATASPENANSNVPYPWDPFHTDDVPGLIWRGTNWDLSVETAVQDPYVVTVYYGGHDNPISDEDYALLLAAGYGEWLT